jgi:hypothetical protein
VALPELTQQVKDLPASSRVEIACGLVSQDQTRPVDEGPGHGHALHFTTRYLVGIVVAAIPEAKLGEEVFHPSPDLWLALGLEQAGEGYILGHGKDRNQVEELEDDPHLVTAVAGKLAVTQAGDILTVHEDAPSVRPVQAADEAQECGLATAALAHDGHELPRPDREAEVVDGKDPLLAEQIGLCKIL